MDLKESIIYEHTNGQDYIHHSYISDQSFIKKLTTLNLLPSQTGNLKNYS